MDGPPRPLEEKPGSRRRELDLLRELEELGGPDLNPDVVSPAREAEGRELRADDKRTPRQGDR